MKSIYYSYDFFQDPALYKDSYVQLDRIEGGISCHYQLLTAYPTFIKQENHERLRLPENAFPGIGKMKPKAKLMHFIADRYQFASLYNCYMIVSKDIIDKFKLLELGESRAYSLPILHKNRLYEYSIFVIQNPLDLLLKAGSTLPDIISVKEGIYYVAYFSEKANNLFKNETNLGLVFRKSREI